MKKIIGLIASIFICNIAANTMPVSRYGIKFSVERTAKNDQTVWNAIVSDIDVLRATQKPQNTAEEFALSLKNAAQIIQKIVSITNNSADIQSVLSIFVDTVPPVQEKNNIEILIDFNINTDTEKDNLTKISSLIADFSKKYSENSKEALDDLPKTLESIFWLFSGTSGISIQNNCKI